jgi:excinuclease ABC subunit C
MKTGAASSGILIEVAPGGAGLEEQLERVPNIGAVFLVWAEQGEPFLARTGYLRRRLKRLLGARSGSSRLLNLRSVARRVEYWPAASRLELAFLHYSLARTHFPQSYLDVVKLRLPPYVHVVLTNEFPRTRVTTRLGGGGPYFGPFRSRAAAEEFEAQMLELFQVRRCQEDLVPSADHPGCIYGEMGMCLRPCQEVVSREEYSSEVERVMEFLHSQGHSLVETISAARDRCSENLDFEEAARQHKRLEKVESVLKLRDELAASVERLYGVAIAPSLEEGAVRLCFVTQGVPLPFRTFHYGLGGEKGTSMDHQLREMAGSVEAPTVSWKERQERLAIFTRWFYSSYRDGEWIAANSLDALPYRKLVRAISRVAKKRELHHR